MAEHPPFDLDAVDLDAFFADLKALRREIDASLGEEDLRHLEKLERWGHVCSGLGLLTAGLAPNPVSAALLGIGRSTRWMLMHHIGHRGYDKVPGVPAKYTSKVFARGRRRFLDWPDWMIPEAWIYEHNVLHHSHTGEERDPDLIERNTEELRSYPKAARYGLLGVLAATWRASYYAPSTLDAWRERPVPAAGDDAAPKEDRTRALWLRCYLPYVGLHFGLMPLCYLPLGPWGVMSAFCNSLMAELVTNLHTFCVVGPNHTGDDLYRFDDRPASRAEHALRQVLGSTNYATGTDRIDFAHLWLNYQIEHHLWPDVPMLQYQRVQPRVKALCEKYGIPYVQEGVFARVKKMVDIAVGNTEMRRNVTGGEARTARGAAPTAGVRASNSKPEAHAVAAPAAAGI
ncbi:fatty acid desaturase family protein [Chondromyces apiculatus]|uniref:Putative LINOLEOYL-CoA DESATURASE (DELTA(6)-DESATURASE) n=1 Tax=Chondromyces apiculatus DSM 436 TaxID=1192034 RepID=A0A017TIW2_9BACT|nr:fatty acid desaturase [Chondromyces apiculatus]EYF08790.1 putative LINOLEOYL-CoA DESATURASE (DELTA(6)-DESATURASE) [Chondromyces apiculatus DSM 436]